MPNLPARPDLGQLRNQAKDLLRAARAGDADAVQRIRDVSEDRLLLSSAQLAVARDYGFASWPRLKREVERRDVLNRRDLSRLRSLLSDEPELAGSKLEHWCDHPKGATPLGYVAMLRFDAPRLGLPDDITGTGEVARALLASGAPVEGDPGDSETPLITAASYGDAEVARALIEAGANLEARASDDAGGVPGGTALLHAAVFGMTDVVDVLVAAGARVDGVVEAAAAGDLTGFLTADTPLESRIRALTMAAGHDRVWVIDELLAAGTPVDGVDAWGSTALEAARENGCEAAVETLTAAGATPR
jgi:ankyrin repeat protein